MKYVYIHGLGQSSESWNNTVKNLKNYTDIVCPDLSAMVCNGGVCYENLYASFSDFCSEFHEPVNLCGLSLGSVLALNYAIDFPRKVSSLVLIAPQYKMPKKMLTFQNIVFRFMPDSMFRQTGFKKADFISLCKSMTKLDFSGSLSEINCPVMIVYGEKDSVNKKSSVNLSEILKNSRLKEVSGAGHEVNTDAPEKLAELLYSFYNCNKQKTE